MNEKEQTSMSRVNTWLVSNRAIVRDGGSFVERAVSIGIAGARIEQVLGADNLRGQGAEAARARGEEIVDVGDDPVVPAFVNGHSHLAMAPLRGITSLAYRAGNVVSDVFFALERHMRPEDVRAFTRLGALESMLFGVGEVWDHYYFGEEIAEGLREAGLSGVVAPTLQDLSGPGFELFERQLAATKSIATGEKFQQAGIAAALGPHASDTVSDELFSCIREVALNQDLPVHLHLAQSIEEEQAASGRFASGIAQAALERLEGTRVLAAHGLYFSRADCERLAEKGVVLAYCPNSQMQFGILSPVAAWARAGGEITLGTDCVASNDALDVQRELPLLGGDAAVGASFSRARESYLLGTSGAPPVEAQRKTLLSSSKLGNPSELLSVGWGASLNGIRKASSGIAVGAVANLLVLDPDHPTLFPGDDLPRTIAYGSTSGAIKWGVFAGKLKGKASGLAREILESDLYAETLIESRRRRDELLERAKMKAALSIS